jgi:hypothetical protein
MQEPTDPYADRRAASRRTAIFLALIAAAIFIAFFANAVLTHQGK